MIRTPYGRDKTRNMAMFLCEHGFNVLIQDSRGRFDSSGNFFPGKNEVRDSHLTIDWIVQQPFSNGKVATTGVSYLGITAWAAAAHKNVVAVAPVIACSRLYGSIFPGGTHSLELSLRWMYLVMRLMKNGGFLEEIFKLWHGFVPFMEHACYKKALRTFPLDSLDELITGRKIDYYKEIAGKGVLRSGKIWKEVDPILDLSENGPFSSGKKTLPGIHISAGWYDFFLDGCLEDFENAKKLQTKNPVRMTIGPWRHWDILKYTSTILGNALQLFDDIDKKGNCERKSKPVRVCVMHGGMEEYEWLDLESWPPVATRTKIMTLKEGFKLSVTQDCQPTKASVTQSTKASVTYTFDPLQPTPVSGGPRFHPWFGGKADQASIECRSDVLVFTSDPLEQPMLVIGYIRVHLLLDSSSKNTDFVVRICDVDLTGKSQNVCETSIRISHNKCVDPDGSNQVEKVDENGRCYTRFRLATAYKFLQNHSIRLHICSGAWPRLAPHPATKPDETTSCTASETTKQHQTVYPNGSSIQLPCL
eukprot:g1218.t1